MKIEKYLKNKNFLVVLILCVLAIAFFASYPYSQTIVSISQIYVDPQGSEVGGEWKGSFWNIVAVVNVNDDLAGVLLPQNQSATITYENVLTTLKTGAKIEIKIDPQPAYLLRNIAEKTVMVTPEVGRTYSTHPLTGIGEALDEVKITELYLRYYDWAEPTFRIYCPFTVSVYKNGALVGQKTFNTEGAATVQSITTSEGVVRIENLGILQGQYLSPNVPPQICILKGYPYIYDLTQVSGLIGYDQGAVYAATPYQNTAKATMTNAYSTYWFGTMRWNNNKHPSALLSTPNLVNAGSYGGWVNTDVAWRYQRDPVKPVIDSTEKGQLPESKRSFQSLTEYIQSRGVQNLASTIFSNYQNPQFITESTGKLSMKLSIPWNGFATYGVPLVNIRVPTELADTWVDRPPISNVSVELRWESTGTDKVDIAGSQRLIARLTQHSNVLSTTEVTIQSGSSRAGLYPLVTRVSLMPGEVKEIYFDVSNLGKEVEEPNVPITVICTDTYTGKETGRDIAYATLLATLIEGQTFLHLKAVEKGTAIPVVGLQIQVLFATESLSGFTDSAGKWNSKLELPSGGAWVGTVQIQSLDTEKYKASYRSVDVQIGINEVTLQIEKKGEGEPPFDWTWFIIVAIAIVAVVLVYYWWRKKRRRH